MDHHGSGEHGQEGAVGSGPPRAWAATATSGYIAALTADVAGLVGASPDPSGDDAQFMLAVKMYSEAGYTPMVGKL